MRRTFTCGHVGKGKFCHRCYQSEKRAADRDRVTAERREQKLAWAASFAADAIDLRPLQIRERITKARELLQRLAAGESYTAMGGKRWEAARTIVSVPLGWGYRLVLRDEDGHLRPVACMTHEAYNNLKPGALR